MRKSEFFRVVNDAYELTSRGIVFEKIVVDFGGYQQSYLLGNESPYVRE